MSSFFEMVNVSKNFGGLTALSDFSLIAAPGELVGLIGPNGAGKTTVFNIISGLLTPTFGDIIWKGHYITDLSAHKRASAGIARTFQNIRLFSDLTVLENVLVSLHCSIKSNFLQAMLSSPRYRSEERRMLHQSMKYLERMGIEQFSSETAGNLPYGLQRKLEIARALAAEPRLLLLDEPVAGMNPIESIEIARLVRSIRDELGISILLIEHDMKFVMDVCERIKVLDHGLTIAEGSPAQIRKNPVVVKAYLGTANYA